jgi:peptide/nickel transport system permease protein
MPKFVLLWTDAALWLLVVAFVAYVIHVRRSPNLRANWRKVFMDGPAMASSVVLVACLIVTLADSIHFRPLLGAASSKDAPVYDVRVKSLLDVALLRLTEGRETTYSRPLAYESFTKETIEQGGVVQRVAPRLVYGGAHLKNPAEQWRGDLLLRAGAGAVAGLAAALLLCAALVWALARSAGQSWGDLRRDIAERRTTLPWHVAFTTLAALGLVAGALAGLSTGYHVFGTDITGNSVLMQTLKSIRTAFVIGSLATLATLPLAVVLGIMAGYFKGWVDEAIQYLYTVLSSIPNILLIAACVLMVQVFLDKHPELFETSVERGDLKLFLLCLVLGLTGWAGLARLLRAETLKLRELEYVQAAQAFGVGARAVMTRHLFPNVAHLMLIVTVLEFSALILYEAVLSYVGVGVDSSMSSFGGMINLARNEMSRDPVVWWPFAAAFVFMVTLVLAANLFADGVRDAFDPRSRSFRPKLSKKAVA